MIGLPEEKILYSEIQKKLFYIIPEKWESIHLYASVIDVPNQKPVGEMFFYYLPKGIIKKKYVNGYEIPSLFNIDDEQYSKLITDVYNSIKLLREYSIRSRNKRWSNINVTIKDNRFEIEYDYEDLNDYPFNSYERHVLWRNENLEEEIGSLSRKDKKIIAAYDKYLENTIPMRKDVYSEGIYKLPVKNIIEFEKTLTVEEAIAQSKEDSSKEIKKGIFKKDSKKVQEEDDDDGDMTYNNQILNWKK